LSNLTHFDQIIEKTHLTVSSMAGAMNKFSAHQFHS